MLPYRKHDLGIAVHLDKNIPVQAGLGGGSSNAAATLLAVNRLWKLGLSQHKLCDIALKIGADVPFFIHGAPAIVQGIGEKITPVAFPQRHILLLTPLPGVATSEAFAVYRAANEKIAGCSNVSRRATGGSNSLVPTVLEMSPTVAQAWQWLSRHAAPRLSGTGSSIFALFKSQKTAQMLAKTAPPQYHAQVCRTLEVSPLLSVCT